jgi:dolichol-phosphate mannosyltransferase
VHNEAENIPALVGAIAEVMEPRWPGRWEQVLVDDGSSDDSAELIRRHAARHLAVRLVSHDSNQGERAAWATALAAARGEIVVMLAADLQNDPRDIPRLIDVIERRGFDCSTGARRARRDGVFFRGATRVLSLFMRLAFDLPVSDVSSSFFAVRRRFVDGLRLVDNDHRYILAILKRRGAAIHEIPTTHRGRAAGRSHYSRLKVVKAVPEVALFTVRLFRGFYDPAAPASRPGPPGAEGRP